MCAVQTRKTKRTTSSVVLFFFVLKHANPCKFRMDNLQITPLIDSTSLGCCWSFSACSYRSLTVGSPIPRRTVKILPNDPSTAWRRPATKVRCGWATPMMLWKFTEVSNWWTSKFRDTHFWQITITAEDLSLFAEFMNMKVAVGSYGN